MGWFNKIAGEKPNSNLERPKATFLNTVEILTSPQTPLRDADNNEFVGVSFPTCLVEKNVGSGPAYRNLKMPDSVTAYFLNPDTKKTEIKNNIDLQNIKLYKSHVTSSASTTIHRIVKKVKSAGLNIASRAHGVKSAASTKTNTAANKVRSCAANIFNKNTPLTLQEKKTASTDLKFILKQLKGTSWEGSLKMRMDTFFHHK